MAPPALSIANNAGATQLNEEDRAVLSFAKSAATGANGNSTHEEPEQQSAMCVMHVP